MQKGKLNPEFMVTTLSKFTNYKKTISIGRQNLVSKNPDNKNSKKKQCNEFCYNVNAKITKLVPL